MKKSSITIAAILLAIPAVKASSQAIPYPPSGYTVTGIVDAGSVTVNGPLLVDGGSLLTGLTNTGPTTTLGTENADAGFAAALTVWNTLTLGGTNKPTFSASLFGNEAMTWGPYAGDGGFGASNGQGAGFCLAPSVAVGPGYMSLYDTYCSAVASGTGNSILLWELGAGNVQLSASGAGGVLYLEGGGGATGITVGPTNTTTYEPLTNSTVTPTNYYPTLAAVDGGAPGTSPREAIGSISLSSATNVCTTFLAAGTAVFTAEPYCTINLADGTSTITVPPSVDAGAAGVCVFSASSVTAHYTYDCKL